MTNKTKYGILEVKYRKISELYGLENNPRYIDPKQMDILITSLVENPEFFFARPILLSNRTGELVVFAGNKRLEAAIEAKMTQVPTILFENLPIEKERELAIRDNVQNGEWDEEILREYWTDVPLVDLGLNLDLMVDAFQELPAEKAMPTDYSVTVYFKSALEQEDFYQRIEAEGYTVKK